MKPTGPGWAASRHKAGDVPANNRMNPSAVTTERRPTAALACRGLCGAIGRRDAMDSGQHLAAIRRAEATDISNIETVARTTWPVAYAGIIPEEPQRRLLDSWYSPQSLSRALPRRDQPSWWRSGREAWSGSYSTCDDRQSRWS